MSEKEVMRAAAREARAAISMIEKAELSARVAEKVLSLPEFLAAKRVLCYAAKKEEVLTGALIGEILRGGRELALPSVRGKHIVAVQLTDPGNLRVGAFQVMESAAGEIFPPESLDLVIVPGVAFDRAGNRVGYGAGYFDRYLVSCRAVKVGLCYARQLVERVPAEPHDVRMDLIVTENEVIRAGGEGACL